MTSIGETTISAASLPTNEAAASDLSSIETTALAVAHGRALEHARTDRLFGDFFAGAFVAAAGAHGEKASRIPSFPDYFAVRTRFFDDYLQGACRAGCRQVVLLAAGLDARAFRLKWPEGVRLFEVELAPMLRFKETVLSDLQIRPSRERIPVAADLRADWQSVLRAAGFSEAAPTAWLAEGLLFYLSSEDGDRLLRQVTELSRPGSQLGVEHVNGAIHRLTQAAMAALAERGTPWISSIEDPAAWLADIGWQATVADHEAAGARYGRPLHTPIMSGLQPKAWLVEARRRES